MKALYSAEEKVTCRHPGYDALTWEFNTFGTGKPRNFRFNFEMEKTDKDINYETK